ncbi:replication protein A 70 kDa DNA-binding subunit D-like [Tripterygium wilfordii]|uniref:replication protein A 70 kDa DNA-binding subunit D-like n=1 Tax=Tripterygium wilfordii TaxID=458696 RepID=UPI0018F83377|nr:replication protein A 70 kDa DNA-binding subunit D-like [Tripterygium wilfordii]
MDYSPLGNLEIGQRGCKIKGRVARLWDSTNPSLKDHLMSVDFLLVDEQGISIQASIRKEDAAQMKELIFEGKVYTIANFIVAAARRTYRVSPHQNMLRIGTWTIIKQVEEPELKIPLNSFSFVDDETLESRLYDDAQLTDTMGHLISVARLTQTYANGRMVGKKNMVIQTLRKKNITVTLWGSVANAFSEEEALKIPKKDPLIVVLTAMIVKSFKAETTLSSTFGTKIYINLDIQEVHQFRKSLSYPNEVTFLDESEQSQGIISNVQHEDERTISQLLSLDRVSYLEKKFRTVGTITDINASKGWWYSACARCRTGVNNYQGIISYDTASATFLVFGKQVEKLINVSAAILSELPESNRTIVPEIMAQILGTKCGFTVSINDRDNHPKILSFNVSQIFEHHKEGHLDTHNKISECGPSAQKVQKNDVSVNINNKRIRGSNVYFVCCLSSFASIGQYVSSSFRGRLPLMMVPCLLTMFELLFVMESKDKGKMQLKKNAVGEEQV